MKTIEWAMPETCDAKSFELLVQSNDLSDINLLQLNFKDTEEVNRSFFPSLNQLKNKLERDAIEIQSIHINEDLVSTLHSNGVLEMFNLQKNIKFVSSSPQKSAKQPKWEMDTAFISPFVRATVETLKVQASIESKAGKPTVKDTSKSTHWDILGIISLVSDRFVGTITLCFNEPVLLQIANSMLMEEYDELNDEIEDSAGELLNIIFGQAKAELSNKQNHKIERAIPTVIKGKQLKIKQSVGPTIQLPFETPMGPFLIEIELSKEK